MYGTLSYVVDPRVEEISNLVENLGSARFLLPIIRVVFRANLGPDWRVG